MATVSLYEISNRPRGGYPPRRRRLHYALVRPPSRSWRLDVTLSVQFVFALEWSGEVWSEARKQAFESAFIRNARRMWSNRFDVVGDRHRVTVRLDVVNRFKAANETWIVNVYPRELRRDQRSAVRCDYDFNGWLHGGPRGPDGGIIDASGPMLRHAAVCYLGEESVSVTQTADSEFRQRGSDHEVGHMLGMQHPLCNDPRNRRCYGDSFQERRRIMGSGMSMSSLDYAWALNLMRIAVPQTTWRLEPCRT